MYENSLSTASAFLHIAHIRNVRLLPGKLASGSRNVAAHEWMFKITRHINELICALCTLQHGEHCKHAQINIKKSPKILISYIYSLHDFTLLFGERLLPPPKYFFHWLRQYLIALEIVTPTRRPFSGHGCIGLLSRSDAHRLVGFLAVTSSS